MLEKIFGWQIRIITRNWIYQVQEKVGREKIYTLYSWKELAKAEKVAEARKKQIQKNRAYTINFKL